MRFFISIFALILLSPTPLTAQQPIQCGSPDSAFDKQVFVPADAKEFCDIYQRRIKYREESLEFEKQLEARQESYHAPSRIAKEQYEADLEALNASR